jgi:hypothetical protein
LYGTYSRWIVDVDRIQRTYSRLDASKACKEVSRAGREACHPALPRWADVHMRSFVWCPSGAVWMPLGARLTEEHREKVRMGGGKD